MAERAARQSACGGGRVGCSMTQAATTLTRAGGARAVLRHARCRDDAAGQWLNTLSARKRANIVTVAP